MLKKITTILCFIILLTLISPAGIILAYGDKTTHPALTDEVVDFYNITQRTNKLDTDDKYWIRQGSIDEDIEPRWIYHFYDPINNTGWNAKEYDQLSEKTLKKLSKMFLSNRDPLSSKEWSQNEEEQETYNDFGGNHTWQKAIRDYAKGNTKEALYSLGHILHLIEDSSVPDHTRNDTHPHFKSKKFNDESPYEMYTMRFKPNSNLNTATSLLKEGVKKSHNFSNLNEAFDYIANYSNNYFFSEDTINSGQFENPKILREDGKYGYGEEKYGTEFPLVKIYKIWNKDKKRYIATYTLKDKSDDELVLTSYWSLLSRQAVLTGAGVIDLFFQEVEKTKQNPELYSNNQKQQTNKLVRSPFGKIAKVSRKVDFVKENIIEPNVQFWQKTTATAYTKTQSYLKSKKTEYQETITSAYRITKEEYGKAFNDYKKTAAQKISAVNEKTEEVFAGVQKSVSGSFALINQEARYLKQETEMIRNWKPKKKQIKITKNPNPFSTWAVNNQPPPTRIRIQEYVDYGGEEKYAAMQREKARADKTLISTRINADNKAENSNLAEVQLPREPIARAEPENESGITNYESGKNKETESPVKIQSPENSEEQTNLNVEEVKPPSSSAPSSAEATADKKATEDVSDVARTPARVDLGVGTVSGEGPTEVKQTSSPNSSSTSSSSGSGNASGQFIDSSTPSDTTPPNIPIITTNNGSDFFTNQNNLTLAGTKTEDSASILINSSENGISYPTNTTWQSPLTLQEGENTFQIKAKDTSENESNQTQIKITLDTINPTNTTDLTATSTSPLTISLNWTQPTEINFDYYQIKYATTTPINWETEANSQNTTSTTLSLNTLNPNETYYFLLKTKDQANNYSNTSNEVSALNASTPDSITDLSTTSQTPTSISLSWTSSSDPYLSSYLIKYSTTQITENNFDSIPDSQTTTNNTITINNLNLSTTYYFAIKVKNTTNYYSSISNIISTQTTVQNYYAMYLIDKQHTNRSTLQGPTTNTIKNTFSLSSGYSGTNVDYDNYVYIWNSIVSIYDLLGNLINSFTPPQQIGSRLTIAQDKSMYYSGGYPARNLYALNPDGTQKWTEGGKIYYTGLKDDAPYVSDGGDCKVKIYDQNGNITRSFDFTSWNCRQMEDDYPVFDNNDNIYIYFSYGGTIYSYDQNGAFRWSTGFRRYFINARHLAFNETNQKLYLQSGSDGILIFNAQDGSYTGLSSIVDPACPIDYDENAYNYGNVSIASDGSFSVTTQSRASMVSYFNSNNEKQWTYCLNAEDTLTQPMFDSDNNIYVSVTNSNISRLISLDVNGNLRWELNDTSGVFDRIITDPVIADDNTIFFVGYDSVGDVWRGVVVGE